jgi:hypothetical protein
MHFQEEAPEELPKTQPPQRPKLDPVDAVVDLNEDDASFPASTFNHLNNNSEHSDNFQSLYDGDQGPPKPPRKQDSSFVGGQPGYSTASLF